jgi:hypothetical protein
MPAGNVVAFDPTRRRPGAHSFAPSVATVIDSNAVEVARRRVLETLKGHGIKNDRIALAQARAERSVKSGVSITDAVYRANAWAKGATEYEPDPAA